MEVTETRLFCGLVSSSILIFLCADCHALRRSIDTSVSIFRVAVSLPEMPTLTEDRPGKNALTVDLTLLFFHSSTLAYLPLVLATIFSWPRCSTERL
jgi:hypothetical protein